MRRVRIVKPKCRRRQPRHEVLALDPRDAGVVRAKSLDRKGAGTR